MLAKKPEPGATFSREINHIVALDEGHSRPVWQWAQAKQTKFKALNRVVPNRPASILLDGVLMLIAGGLGSGSLASAFDLRDEVSERALIDLENTPLATSVYDSISEELRNHNLYVVVFEGSAVIGLIEGLREKGVTVTVLAPDN